MVTILSSTSKEFNWLHFWRSFQHGFSRQVAAITASSIDWQKNCLSTLHGTPTWSKYRMGRWKGGNTVLWKFW
jgi:hypothetical protein